MTIFAPALVGVPPVGLGVYARGRVGEPGPWSWYTGREWSFVGVDGSNENSVIASADRAMHDALDNGRSGVILDPETVYDTAHVETLARWIRGAAARVRIGVTSFPSWGGIDDLARLAPGLFWGSPQLYYDAATNRAGWERWHTLFGFRMIPSVAAYVSGPITTPAVAALRGSAAGYAAHLSSIPRAGGAIVWPNWPVPQYMQDALRARWGIPATPMLIPGALAASIDTWPGLVAVVAFALVFVLSMLRVAR